MKAEETKIRVLAEGGAAQDASAFKAGTRAQTDAAGSSGTEIYSGYFNEEYLHTLKGADAALIWDKMRRSEAQVAMLLNAIFNPIKAATWEIAEASQEQDAIKHAKLCRAVIFDGLDFETFKHEALTLVAFGYSVFEAVHSVVFSHPEFGTFNGLKALGFRSQKTIQAWNLEKKTGRILSIDQWAQGDVGERVLIPGEFLMVLTNQKEGDNYEGISALRPMYGAYTRKQLYLKLCAIGVERYAVGVPKGKVPKGQENTKDFENFQAMLAGFTSHETSYITTAEGWDVEIIKGQFDADKIVELLKFENTEMINAVVANFLALGTNGSGGAFALSNDLSDFFTAGIQAYADVIAAGFNRKIIPDLCKLNYGPLPAYPKMKVSGISDKAGKELADILKTLIDSKAIKPDTPLETSLREKYKLPKADETTSREVNTSANLNVNGPPTPAQVKLAEGATENAFTMLIDSGKANTKALMQAKLKEMGNAVKKKLIDRYKATPTDQGKAGVAATVDVPPEMIAAYQLDLRGALAEVALKSFMQASHEAPKGKSKRLAECLATIKLAAPDAPQGVGYYEALPPLVKKAVETQAQLIADSQAADVQKVVTFQFASSETGTDDPEQIEKEVEDALNKVLSGDNTKGMSVDAAAGDAVAKVANQARTEYFFEPDVLAEIESFTFENNDPVSEICQELAGTTFAPDDPQVDEFWAPLHHNCKSTMRANLKGTNGPSPITGKADVSEKGRKSITL